MQNNKDTFEYTLGDTGYSVQFKALQCSDGKTKRFFVSLRDRTYEADVRNILCVDLDPARIEKGADVFLFKDPEEEYPISLHAERHTVPFKKEYCLLAHDYTGGILTWYFPSEYKAIKKAYENLNMEIDFEGGGKIKTKNAKHQLAFVREDGTHPFEYFVFKKPTDILGRIKNSLLFARSAIRVFTETEGDTYFFMLHLEDAANATIDLEKIPLEKPSNGNVVLLASGVETFEETFATAEEAIKRMQIGAEKFRKKYRNSIWDEDDLIERDDGGCPQYEICSSKAYQVYKIEDAPKTYNDKVRNHMWMTDTILNCCAPESMKSKIFSICNKRLDEVEQEIERLWGAKGEQ